MPTRVVTVDQTVVYLHTCAQRKDFALKCIYPPCWLHQLNALWFGNGSCWDVWKVQGRAQSGLVWG